jgi:hypothetical protein
MDVVIQPDRLAAANAAHTAPLNELTPAPIYFVFQDVPRIAYEVNRTNVQHQDLVLARISPQPAELTLPIDAPVPFLEASFCRLRFVSYCRTAAIAASTPT